MDPKLKRKLAIGAAGMAALAGAGGTYAATQASGVPSRQAFLNDVAKRLNVSPQNLTKALQGAQADRLDALVAAGKLTRAQADQILKHAKQGPGAGPLLGPGPGLRGGPPGGGFGPGGRRFGPRRPGGGPLGGAVRGGLDAAAKYLGLTDAELLARLRAGKSLADVAGTQKKSLAGLESAITAAVKTKLDAAVSSKRITSAQEQRILGALGKRIDALVKRKGFGPRAGPRGGPGFGHGFGPGRFGRHGP